MRIVTLGLFTAFVMAITNPAFSPEQEALKADHGVDPIVTGESISAEHLANWQAQRNAYLECPECVASQPFPED
ncbi:MAG: hypothetical protein AAGA53_04495 [Pseudomonadota bacterium]